MALKMSPIVCRKQQRIINEQAGCNYVDHDNIVFSNVQLPVFKVHNIVSYGNSFVTTKSDFTRSLNASWCVENKTWQHCIVVNRSVYNEHKIFLNGFFPQPSCRSSTKYYVRLQHAVVRFAVGPEIHSQTTPAMCTINQNIRLSARLTDNFR